MELETRRLRSDELPSLLSLYRHLHATDDPLPAAADVQALWNRILVDPALIYLGGFLGGELVAAANAAIIPNLTRGARPYAVIENAVTRGHLRGRGYGSAVMQALLAACWMQGCYKVMLQSGMQRQNAHGFYEANGFDKHSKQAFIIRTQPS